MKKKTFTLIELLVVVAILSILAGGAVAVYDGLEKKAAKAQARAEIAQLQLVIKNYHSLNNGLYPSNWDSLLSVPGNSISATPNNNYGKGNNLRATEGFISSTPDNNFKRGVLEITDLENNSINFISWLSDELLSRLQLVKVNQVIVDILAASGIRSLRYVDQEADHNSSEAQGITLRDASNTGTKIEKSEDIINASKVFENPTSPNVDILSNLGRGFTFQLSADPQNLNDGIVIGGGKLIMAALIPGPSGSTNTSVGGSAADLILAFGIGNNTSLVNTEQASDDANNTKTSTGFSAAPKYGSTPRKVYGRYIALFKVADYVVNGAPDITQFSNPSLETTPNKKIGGAHPSNTPDNNGFLHPIDPTNLTEYDPSSPATSGIRYSKNGALFVGVIDCYGNTSKEISNQLNK